MKYTVDVRCLSQDFYNAYPLKQHPEMMYKDGRPYTCLLIKSHDGYSICIPFRSSIRHNDAFIFFNTNRSLHTRSGLDYQKVVLIENLRYIDLSKKATVDNDEYVEVINNIEKIISGVENYITRYVRHINGSYRLHIREYERHYLYSTLPYFHDILGL